MRIQVNSSTALRIPDNADVPEFFKLIHKNLEHLAAWRTWTADMLTLSRVQQFVERNRRSHQELLNPDFVSGSHPGFSFLIETDGRPAGMAGFQGINRTNDIAALGYWIDKSCAGRGITTAAMFFVIQYAFEVLDMNRLEIQTLVSNRASARVAEKLRFTREAVLLQVEKSDSGYADHYLYRLLRSEWDASRIQSVP